MNTEQTTTLPMHYLANTLYHAGDKDHYGRAAGEPSQFDHCIQFGNSPVRTAFIDPDIAIRFHTIATDWSEGKPRQLDYARSCAVWPDATDEELTSPDLKRRLIERLPALMLEFKAAVESLGLVY